MARLFDAYIIVDWSAAGKPAQGANSVWIGALARDARLKFRFQSARNSLPSKWHGLRQSHSSCIGLGEL